MKYKFLYPFLGVGSGIFLSSEIFNGFAPGCILIGLSIGVWLLLHILAKDPVKGLSFSGFHHLWIFLLFAGLGSLDFYLLKEPSISREIEGRKSTFTGRIEEVKYFADGDRFKVKINSIRDSIGTIYCRNLSLLLRTDGFIGSKGDIINFEGVAVKPKDKLAKDYAERVRHQGIAYISNVKWTGIHKIGEYGWLTEFSKLREDLTILIERSSLDREAGDFLISLLLGDKSFLSTDRKQTLSSAGVAHILALSGLHVAIILGVLLTILYPLSFLGFSKGRKVIAIFLIWCYVLLTGGAPSTLRAAIMATMVTLAFIMERRNSAFNSLLAAVMIILLIDPLSLWDVGLQLSFLSVGAIILFANNFNPIERHNHPRVHYFANAIIVTVVATFSTWVLVAYHFKSVPLLFLPSNLILLPLLPIYIFCGFFFILFLSMGIEINFLSKGLEYFHWGFMKTADFLSASGKASLNITPGETTLWFWLIALLCLAIAINYKKSKISKSLGGASLVLSFLSLALLFLPAPQSPFMINFPHSFTNITAKVSYDNTSSYLIFPRNNISRAKFKNMHILSIDEKVHPDSVSVIFPDKETVNILIAGPRSDSSQIAEIINNNEISQVVLHAGIGKNKKAELLRLVEESKWENIHSLRENGSLDLEL